MDNSIRIPLDLPDVRVLDVSKTDQGAWLIRVESTLNGTQCHQCGRQITHCHGVESAIRLRHLPLFETPVFIEFCPKRYRCPFCEGMPTTTQQLSWHELRSPNTKPYEQWLLRMLINSTVADVARKLTISEETVAGVLKRWVPSQVNWDEFDQIEVVGIDEMALKRGHRDYITLVSVPLMPSGVEIIAILADRKKQTVVNFFSSIPSRLKGSIQRVCTDMYQGFVAAAEEQLPAAKIVVDRFHVTQAYRGCADTVRKHEVKRLKQELSTAEYQQIKGAMWPFRKASDDLNDDERALLERLFTYSPKLEKAYTLREELTEIFERDYTKVGAKCAIRAWCKRVRKSGLDEFESFLGTVDTWLDKITNYFLEGWSSGFVEGFNNRVKVLKRRCYGIFDVDRIFQRLTLDINGYERFSYT
ncbi:transposase [Leptolyngbya sp. Heron Island J]|uniref:ISL3 family transposase n=1 Tax=Leptolyngbya sp. Heron Island J TaxID=1385935 RepID=UPI0003B953C1|nr:ISL3 family transposase [Leptolyngbya sp. Heron Island J]ESA35925.1 transposase [Leptolyngbya sp. Heron Island J]